MKKDLKIDLTVLIAWILVSVAIILLFKVRFLVSTTLYFIVPSIYLFVRKPKNIKRLLAGSFLFGIIYCFFLDFMAELNKAWDWAPFGQLYFSNKIFGLIPIDVMIWYFFWIFFMIIFYEHFIEHDRSDKISLNYGWGVLPALSVIIGTVIIYFINPELLRVRYTYLFLGSLTVLPFAMIAVEHPKMIKKFLGVSVFFFILNLIFEITALRLKQWVFPGNYIGMLSFGQNVKIPIEEFFFWIFFSTFVVLAYFEHFVGDEK